MEDAKSYFIESVQWLRQNYMDFIFYVERDVVWTVQMHIISLFQKSGSNLKIFNDYGILPGVRRSLSADLVIVNPSGRIHVAVEFKYEPSHMRTDIPKNKFPVVAWGKEGVAKDIKRIKQFVNEADVESAFFILIDEAGYFKNRHPHPGSKWKRWFLDTWVLWSEIHKGSYVNSRKNVR